MSLQRLIRRSASVGLLLVAIGCGIDTGDEGGPRERGDSTEKLIGITLMTYDNEFFIALRDAAKIEAQKHGYTLLEHNAKDDNTKQFEAVRNFITREVSAILLNPVDSAASAAAVKAANAAGIPVICVDVRAGGGDVASFVVSDNRSLGVLCGEYLAKRLDGKGKVAMVTYHEVSSGKKRYEGVMSVLAKYPDIEIVAEQPSQGRYADANTATQNILTAHPDLDAIWAINDPSALGCAAAIELLGPRSEVFVVGVDGAPTAVDAIRRGTPLAATAAQYPQRIGKTGVEMALRAIRGDPLERSILIPGSLITAENAASYEGWK